MLLTKLVTALAYPLSVALITQLIGLILLLSGRRRGGAAWIVLGIGVIWACAMPVVAGRLYSVFESQYPPQPVAEMPVTEAVVVLGGSIGAPLPPRVTIDLTGDADRVYHAAALYRAGKAPLVIASGGDVFPESATTPEAHHMAALLAEWGVPGSAIVIEPASRTTRENALHTARLLQSRNIGTVLLVTSALHMPRALATFRAADVDALPAPTDIRVVRSDAPATFGWVPTAGALEATTRVIHEWLGTMYYRWRGWL